MALEFTICELRWARYHRVSENPHARQGLEFQAARRLAANTLDAYGRDLDRYVGSLEGADIPLEAVNRSTLAGYLRSVAQLRWTLLLAREQALGSSSPRSSLRTFHAVGGWRCWP